MGSVLESTELENNLGENIYDKERLLLLTETAKNSEILMHNMKKQFLCTSF